MSYTIEDSADAQALGKAIRDMIGINNPEALFSRICECAVELADFTWSVLGLVDYDEAIRPVAGAGDAEIDQGNVIRSGEGIGGAAVRTRSPYLVGQEYTIDNENLRLASTARDKSGTDLATLETFVAPGSVAVAYPVIHGGLVVAVLYAGRSSEHEHASLAIVSELAAFAAPLIVSAVRISELENLAKAEERQRIVRHLHGTSLQYVFNISLSAQRLGEHLREQPELLEVVEAISADSRLASECLRNTFRANLGTERDLLIAMRELTKAFSFRTTVPAEVTILGEPRRCPEQVNRVLLEAAREMLHNIEKHARAKFVMVGLAFGENELTLVIQDDGIGMAQHISPALVSSGASGLGLASVNLAAASLGGQLHLVSNDDGGGGLTVRMRLPLLDAA